MKTITKIKTGKRKQVYYFALDHSGGVKDYPISTGVVKIDDWNEVNLILKDLRNYLKEKKLPLADKQEIKWTNLRVEERYWLANRISKSKLKFSGVYVKKSIYSDMKDTISKKTGYWQYKLFGIWYFKALKLMLNKKEYTDVHIDKFLENRGGKATKEMEVILNTMKKLLKTEDYSTNVGLHGSEIDTGIQIADYIAGMIRSLKNIKKKYKKFSLPKNITADFNPDVKEELRIINAYGTSHTRQEPHKSKHYIVNKYLNFSFLKTRLKEVTSAEIRSEYLKHSLVINENNYLTYYAGNLTLNTSINPSKWYHIAGTYNDDGEANLFLDGVNVQSDYNGAKIKSNLYKAWIGKRVCRGCNPCYGTIDNVAIYSKVLSNQTIKSHYERGLKTYSLNRLRTTSTKEQWNKTIMNNLRVVW